MEEALEHFFQGLHSGWLALVIAASLAVLAKAADWLVDEAVELSSRSGVPKVVIGATIVSLGTTAPEAAVSVFAAIQGQPGLALGNAVGSIICDTGLILGLASVIAPLKLDRRIVNRQGWIQLGAAAALVACSFPWSTPAQVFSSGGNLPRSGRSGFSRLPCRLYVAVDPMGAAGAGSQWDARGNRAPHAAFRTRQAGGCDSAGCGRGARLDSGGERVGPALGCSAEHHRVHGGGLRHVAAGTGDGGHGGAARAWRAGGGQRGRRGHPKRAVRGRWRPRP